MESSYHHHHPQKHTHQDLQTITSVFSTPPHRTSKQVHPTGECVSDNLSASKRTDLLKSSILLPFDQILYSNQNELPSWSSIDETVSCNVKENVNSATYKHDNYLSQQVHQSPALRAYHSTLPLDRHDVSSTSASPVTMVDSTSCRHSMSHREQPSSKLRESIQQSSQQQQQQQSQQPLERNRVDHETNAQSSGHTFLNQMKSWTRDKKMFKIKLKKLKQLKNSFLTSSPSESDKNYSHNTSCDTNENNLSLKRSVSLSSKGSIYNNNNCGNSVYSDKCDQSTSPVNVDDEDNTSSVRGSSTTDSGISADNASQIESISNTMYDSMRISCSPISRHNSHVSQQKSTVSSYKEVTLVKDSRGELGIYVVHKTNEKGSIRYLVSALEKNGPAER